jgi:hypothetical protein
MKQATQYSTPDFPYYEGNILIEALTPHIISGKKDLLKTLTTIKDIPEDIFTYDEFLASDYISQSEDTYIPHKDAWVIYKNIIQKIKIGYRNKNPLSQKGKKYLNLITIMNQQGCILELEKRVTSITGKASCSLGVGLSGLGKSETITSVLNCIPQVISHTEYKGEKLVLDQLVWVSFDVTSTNSIKGLAVNFFIAVDEALGTNYATKYNNHRESVDVFIGNMRMVCAKHSIGFVHVDECQHLLRRMKSNYSASVTHLESLFNRIGIPMLMTCTPDGMKMFFETDIDNELKPRLEVIRRLISGRVYNFEPLGLGSESYDKFFDAFLPPNVFEGTDVGTQAFKEKVHYFSFGIHAVAARLMTLFFEVVQQNQNYLTSNRSIELLEKIYSQHFEHMKVAIGKLRRNKAQEWEMLHEKQIEQSKDINENGAKIRTLHSSRRAPKMATENAKERIKQSDVHSAFKSIEAVPLTIGLSEIHQ